MLNTPKPGQRVRTAKPLGSTAGMTIVESRLLKRRPNVVGRIAGFVAGHGGDVWWVRHAGADPDDVAAYATTEITDEPEAAT